MDMFHKLSAFVQQRLGDTTGKIYRYQRIMLKMKKIGLHGANKRGKTLAGHELGKSFFKDYVWGNILSGKDDF